MKGGEKKKNLQFETNDEFGEVLFFYQIFVIYVLHLGVSINIKKVRHS